MTPACRIFLLFALVAPAQALAYDAPKTHRWITRTAAATLVATYPGRYDEISRYVDLLAEGAEHEDDIFIDGDDDPQTLRVMRHFYRPSDHAGLFMYERTWPSSFMWGAVPNVQNPWGFDDALEAYQAGDLEDAYFTLGHVVHLIQDLTVPAHTHLDIHGPPYGDDYEAYCSTQTSDEKTSLLPRPAPGTPIPHFETLAEAWDATARASYWRNMYGIDLSNPDAPAGQVAIMFPSLSWDWFGETFAISDPPVGKLGVDFFEEIPGFIYFKNSEHIPEADRTDFDVELPSYVVIDDNHSDQKMTAGFARDLVPIAILHSAAVMKMFMDRVNDLPPPPPVEKVGEEVAPEAIEACAATSTPWAALVLLLLARRRRS